MSVYWLRVESVLLYLVRSSDMAGAEPKMAGIVRSTEMPIKMAGWALKGAQRGLSTS